MHISNNQKKIQATISSAKKYIPIPLKKFKSQNDFGVVITKTNPLPQSQKTYKIKGKATLLDQNKYSIPEKSDSPENIVVKAEPASSLDLRYKEMLIEQIHEEDGIVVYINYRFN